MENLPSFDELPLTAEGARSAWGVFGADDNVGTVNLLTPERVAAAAQLVRRGARFALDAPIDFFTPQFGAMRGRPRHEVLHRMGTPFFDDVIDNFYPQGSSQWDALGHAAYDTNAFYNGATEDDILAGRRNTIEHWSTRGIAGRAVLLDMVRTFAQDGRPYDPGASIGFTVEDLERARVLAGVELQTGDILLIYTGVDEWYRTMSDDERYALFPAKGWVTMAGIDHSEEVCRYLWDHHIAVIASDTVAVEVCPPDEDPANVYGGLHRILIGQFGMMLGELLWLRDLAADCAKDGVYEMFFTASPLHVIGGIGSTTNAMAIK